MKKIAATFAFLSLFILGIQAQEDFRFGFEASPSISWMRTDDNKIEGNGANLGMRLGVQGEKYFRENYALTFGLGFAFNQGGTLNHTVGGDLWPTELSNQIYHELPNDVDLKYRIQYVEMPFGFKMRTNEFGYIRGFAELPRFILGFRSQARGDIDAMGIDNSEKEAIKKVVHPITISWGLGAGAEYVINENTAIVAGLYFQNSFIDITKNDGKQWKDPLTQAAPADGPKEDSKATIGSLTLRIGVIF
jgi:opacity protein-like surface antigen